MTLRAVGVADACELLSCLFAFPTEALVEGLVSGTAADDAAACLADAGVAEEKAERIGQGLRQWAGDDEKALFTTMRRTYTQLYLAPGGNAEIFPYESAFQHVQRGLPGKPALFRTPITLDVERQMREAGVRAKNDRREPCDSASEEFEFLSYLVARQADALSRGDAAEAAVWEERAARFNAGHGASWLSSFMERTVEADEKGLYAAFAEVGLALLEVIS